MSQQQSGVQVDPRGLRFAAGVTTVVLAATLVLNSPWPLAFQAVVFAIAAGFGVQASPYGLLYKSLVRPRLGPPEELESAAPPRFAQLVGLVFAVIGLAGYLAGATVVGVVATAFALVAALLNAAVGLCLGCEVYLLIQRIRSPQHLKEQHT
jgi:Domain of unknown function (DUF4395)